MTRLAIIGGGLAGSSLGHLLQNDATIDIFEKARGLGGRMATRYADDFEFDHGTQFFTVRHPAFQDFLAPYMLDQTVRPWEPRCVYWDGENQDLIPSEATGLFVATPRMNSLVKKIVANLTIQRATRIMRMEKMPQGWILYDHNNQFHGPYDWVISTAPAPQTFELFPKSFIHRYRRDDIRMRGCFTLMLGFTKPFETGFDFAKGTNSIISSLALNSHKPQRPNGMSLVIHSDNQWADTHIEDDKSIILHQLKTEAENILEHPLDDADYESLHRWRYALCDKPLQDGFLVDRHQKLAVCGDWCEGGRIENAFLSAYKLASFLRTV